MATQNKAFDGELWFFTSISSGKVHEIQADQHVNLAYADPGSNRYVSVSGIANVVQDRRKADELWNAEVQAWFPKGLDDPELALIHVEVTEAQYWDAPSSRMTILAKYAKAIVTGERPKKMGENKKLDFN
jgi:general stress protein 26